MSTSNSEPVARDVLLVKDVPQHRDSVDSSRVVGSADSECPAPEDLIEPAWRWGPQGLLAALSVFMFGLVLMALTVGADWGGHGPAIIFLGIPLGVVSGLLALLCAKCTAVLFRVRPHWTGPVGRLWSGLRYVLLLLLVAVVVVEWIERTFNGPLPDLSLRRTIQLGPERMFQHDAELGWIGTKNLELTIMQGGRKLRLAHNAEGFRDIEVNLRMDGGPRMVVLGDSVARGWGVELDESLTGILRRELPDYQVANFAMSAYSMDQVLLTYRRYARPLRPKVVVVCVIGTHPEESKSVATGWPKPWCVTRGGHLDWYGLPVPSEPMEREARLRYRAQSDYLRVTTVAESIDYLSKSMRERSGLVRRVVISLATKVWSAEQRHRVDPVTLALVRQLRSEVELDLGQLIILSVPPPWMKTGYAVLHEMEPVNRALASTGARVIDVGKSFLPKPAEFFTCGSNRHPNERGHAAMANSVLKLLRLDSNTQAATQVEAQAESGAKAAARAGTR